MKNKLFPLLWLFIMNPFFSIAQGRLIRTGEVPGYVTLKCDFHTHTIFSDGEVWPTVRIDEAEREGLDAIAIADHLEYQPKKDWVPVDLNAGWKIAGLAAAKKGILLVHAAEITRKMPPGHLNALFIEDASRLTDTDFMAVIQEAVKQGAFIQWNHPGWKAQRPTGNALPDSIHKVLLNKGWLNGIEFVNDVESYRGVLPQCLEKGLAVMANSDIHGPYRSEYYPGTPPHRPITLVFAKKRNIEALKEALMEGRTLAWFGDSLAGNAIYADPFVSSCLETGKPCYTDEKYSWRKLINRSDIPFELILKSEQGSGNDRRISLPANSSTSLRLPLSQGRQLKVVVTNVLVNDGRLLELTLPLEK